MFDETLRQFMTGQAESSFELLNEYELLEPLFPATAIELYDSPTTLPLIRAAMHSTDTRIAEDKPVTPAFVLAALLWVPTLRLCRQREDRGVAPLEAMREAGQSIIAEQLHHIAIPRRFTATIMEIWELQLRLQKRNNRRAVRLLEHRRFRAAYDFLLLREQAGEDLNGLGEYWTEMQEKHPDVKPDLNGDREENDAPARPRRRRRRWRPKAARHQ